MEGGARPVTGDRKTRLGAMRACAAARGLLTLSAARITSGTRIAARSPGPGAAMASRMVTTQTSAMSRRNWNLPVTIGIVSRMSLLPATVLPPRDGVGADHQDVRTPVAVHIHRVRESHRLSLADHHR